MLEVETGYQIETPKDHCRVNKISYQFIDSGTLEPFYHNDQIPTLLLDQQGMPSFQETITQLDKEIQSCIGEGEFVLCSLNSTWDIRVTIPRQARDDGFMLPSYMQHPKVFDMWKEYDRWCINHPEVMPLRKSFNTGGKKSKDLNEMLKVLDISRENRGDAFDLTRTSDILLQLHKKCSTPEDLSMVLTRPYDSHLDIRTFLQEHSKVLYLNNLPPDTTQSELESWFTQFGARPVGFWTVKNIVEETSNVNNNWSMNNSPYVEEQDSISGFVVFQTHEEATEVLVLNGRSILSNMANTKQPRVVEHIVEIQPSSTRVLDRAQEILSPFPQSKNKPRPGDWNCPSCGFSNFQRRTSCFRCSFSAASAVQVNNKQYMNSNAGNSNGSVNKLSPTPTQHHYQVNLQSQQQQPQQQQQQLLQQDQQLQQQEQQEQLQPNLSDHIQQQQHPRTGHTTPTYTDAGINMNHGGPPYRYVSNNGSNINFNNGSNNNRFSSQPPSNSNGSNGSSNVPFRAGDWKCLACTYHNFAKNVVCLRCGGPKVSMLESENNKNGNNNNSNDNNNSYNRSGSVMNLPSMGSTVSLNEYSRKGNNNYIVSHNNYGSNNNNGNELGISLDERRASEPKW